MFHHARNTWCVLGTLVLLPFLLSRSSAQSIPNVQATNSTQKDGTTLLTRGASPIGVGDLLDVNLYTSPAAQAEFTERVRVGGDGTIQLPLLGTFHVAGLALEAAEVAIAGHYIEKGIYNHAEVNLVVVDYGVQHSVSVSGEVLKPGVFPVNGPIHVADALALAGGLTPRAGRHIFLQGITWAKPLVVPVPNGAAAPEDDPVISAGDKVIVERAGIVYVVGDVNKPGGFVMDNTGNLSVLQALALAEGTRSTAALNHAQLIRTIAGARTQTPLPVKKMLRSQAADVLLQADDIVFIPSSAAKAAAQRTLETVVHTASGLAVYGRY